MDLSAIMREVDLQGFSIMMDDELMTHASGAREEYLGLFADLPLHAPREPMVPSFLETLPWRKLAIGSKNGVGDPYAQFLQTTYFGRNGNGSPHIKGLFDRMVVLRNRATQLNDSFGEDPELDGFWNARRIHHYPRGGGFMMRHRDTHFPAALQKSDAPFLQMMVLLSEKGFDFHEGGGFVESSSGERRFPEDDFGVGSIVFFDERTFHGVDDIDPYEVCQFNAPSGRFAAFVNLYAYLE